MGVSYKDRLLIDIDGNDVTVFQTTSGETIAIGYKRVVIGKRGPYIEFLKEQINADAIFIPGKERYRLTSDRVYYNEWRSLQDDVMLYEQKKTVAYADYLIGMWYVSPLDVTADGKVILELPTKEEPKVAKNQRNSDLFIFE